jgi:hypothetical protein
MSMRALVASPLGFLVGVALGALGGGGSILAVPVLVFIVGLSPSSATSTSLVVVGAASLVGAYEHWRSGHVRVATGLVFGLVGIGGSVAGSTLNRRLDGDLLLLAFAGLTLVAAWRILAGCPSCTKVAGTGRAGEGRPGRHGRGLSHRPVRRRRRLHHRARPRPRPRVPHAVGRGDVPPRDRGELRRRPRSPSWRRDRLGYDDHLRPGRHGGRAGRQEGFRPPRAQGPSARVRRPAGRRRPLHRHPRPSVPTGRGGRGGVSWRCGSGVPSPRGGRRPHAGRGRRARRPPPASAYGATGRAGCPRRWRGRRRCPGHGRR